MKPDKVKSLARVYLLARRTCRNAEYTELVLRDLILQEMHKTDKQYIIVDGTIIHPTYDWDDFLVSVIDKDDENLDGYIVEATAGGLNVKRRLEDVNE